MTATTIERQADRKGRLLHMHELPVAASSKILKGTPVAVNASGYCVEGDNSEGLLIVGMAAETVDNSDGSDGDVNIAIYEGIFDLENDAAGQNPVAITDVGKPVYLHDNQTVCTDAEKSATPCGILVALEDGVPYVRMGMGVLDIRQLVAGVENLTAAGAASIYKLLTTMTVDNATAVTLADGLFVGQLKFLRLIGGTTPDVTFTPANFADGTSLTIDAATEEPVLVWDGAAWNIAHLGGATLNA